MLRGAAALLAVSALVGLAGCRETPPPSPRDAAAERIRTAVLAGARRDFLHAEGASRGFVRCFVAGLRRELDRETLEWLRVVRSADGRPAAARGLNTIAAPVGDRCGERWTVPQLIEAARGLDGSFSPSG
ncbi:MAG: hypothetical protein ACRDL0_06505 [Thermoleophilaceae bacterium]